MLYVPARARSNFTPASPVLFSLNGVLGISVSQAVAEEYIGLDGRDNGVSSFERGKTSCRIQVGITALRKDTSPTLSLVP